MRLICVCALIAAVVSTSAVSQPNVRNARQGYSMRLSFNNKGVIGRDSYSDSVGLEYPIGSTYEHIYGAGLWIGGILDTSTSPTPAYIRTVSTTYEGWAGPLYEFYPGTSPADSIWKVNGRGVPRPPSWDTYWGNAIPQYSFSDNDHYCVYDDYHVPVIMHSPLRLKVVQSSFVWSDPYAEGIHIMEYKIINLGVRQIDSVYVGTFLDVDYGPRYYGSNVAGYLPAQRTMYHNTFDAGSTPVGVATLHATVPLDSLRFAFRCWPGPLHPGNDAGKYALLSSGIIQPGEPPVSYGIRCLLSFGPFVLPPPGHPLHDTLVVAIGIVCSQDVAGLPLRVERALAIYLNGGQVAVDPPANGGPERFELLQNYPNPFNPSTTIRYSLPRNSFVTLTVCNILGQQVAKLVDDRQMAGNHEVVFRGDGLASGLYVYRLQASGVAESRKMILLK